MSKEAKNQNGPEYKKGAFICPHCYAYAHHVWQSAFIELIEGFEWFSISDKESLETSKCNHCGNRALWLVSYANKKKTDGRLIYPVPTPEPLPDVVSNDIRSFFNAANAIATDSPKAAVALLRTTLEMLCQEILKGKAKGKRLGKMTEMIAKEHSFDPTMIKAMKIIRVYGNDAVHNLGKLDEKYASNPGPFFDLVRYIVRQAITQHLDAQEIIEQLEVGKK